MRKKFALGALLITALTAAATATATLLEISDDVNIIKRGAKIPGISGVLDDVESGDPQTIVILGSDRRWPARHDKSAARSDTILLVRLAPSKDATAVLSIPRDLVVDIPGHGRDKINAAYSLGGPKLTVQTIRELFGFPVNHVVNINFGGFTEAVDRLGCVYVDIDRRYFNDNNPPVGGGGRYATIDIQPGYQKLCGSDALDYVRFRHLDTDFVRAARQQDFLRQAKDQFGFGKIFSSRKQLLRIFSAYTQTDIRSTPAILRLLKLAFESSQHPVREVHFRASDAGDAFYSYVSATPEDIEHTRNEFLGGGTPVSPKESRKVSPTPRRGSEGLAEGIVADWEGGLKEIEPIAARPGFPVYYPGHRLAKASYVEDPPRVYDIYDRGHRRYRAYRIVADTGDIGQYYGIQGTSWTNPPLLDSPSETREIRGRKFELFYDGRRLRLVALRTKDAVYWVTNTLLQTLSNRQMLDIAVSLRRTRLGSR
jgi:LCP family protein required for cell wall assembly